MTRYGLYKNNKLIMLGTAPEIAEYEDIKIDSVYYYASEEYKRRCKYGGDHKKVMKVNEDQLKLLKLEMKINKIKELCSIGFGIKESIKLCKGVE